MTNVIKFPTVEPTQVNAVPEWEDRTDKIIQHLVMDMEEYFNVNTDDYYDQLNDVYDQIADIFQTEQQNKENGHRIGD